VPRTVLITNIGLCYRSGTEVVVEQLADGLRRRGHRPLLFAPLLGPLAEAMRARGHLVSDRPDGLRIRPDIIHAHHTGPAMAALAAHPGVPALFVCHDATSAFDALPKHPRLRRLFAVDERCRARLVDEGADPVSVELLPNAVDLTRIPGRAPLPERPRRAVAVTKHSLHLDALRAACATAGIEFAAYGFGADRMIERPEELFVQADIVFATARTALEASAAGAGVVVCDARGCAGFLTRSNAEAWLPYNLGAAVLSHPCDAAHVSAAIAAWSAEEATAASVLVQKRRALEAAIDRLETIYAEMLAAPPRDDVAADATAIGAFIADWVPHFGQRAPWRRLAEQVADPALSSPANAMKNNVTTLVRRVDTLAEKVDILAGKVDMLAGKVDTLASAPRSLSLRLEDMLRGLWRRVLPVRLREPLYRFRRRLLTALLR
jgi:Glycosyltransferase Family 4